MAAGAEGLESELEVVLAASLEVLAGLVLAPAVSELAVVLPSDESDFFILVPDLLLLQGREIDDILMRPPESG